MASYNIFNYHYRPAKSIERKLFIELLKELYGVNQNKDLGYIGLGSVFFADFKLIHKELGLSNLINIEMNEDDMLRFEFNKPFSCIKLKWGKTTDVLPNINWTTGKKILWLDYDQSLQPYMFEDIDTFFSEAPSESFFLLTCNYSFHRYLSENVYNEEKFKKDFEGICRLDVTKEELTKKNAPILVQEMIKDRIESNLSSRNAALSDEEKLEFHQLIFITYQDGAPMFTYGGYLLRKELARDFKKLQINKLPYVRSGEDFLNLQSPVVTTQELDAMNNFLPNYPSRFLSIKKITFIPEEERKKYLTTYRYYPNFVEIRD